MSESFSTVCVVNRKKMVH